MSRTVKGKKAPSHEYWAKRPGPREPGRITKTITHRKERQESKRITRKEQDE